MTGQAYPSYTSANNTNLGQTVVHTDGTIFTLFNNGGPYNGSAPMVTVVAINPLTGQPKFSVSLENSVQTTLPGPNSFTFGPLVGNMIIAGDGYAYLPYSYIVDNDGFGTSSEALH